METTCAKGSPHWLEDHLRSLILNIDSKCEVAAQGQGSSTAVAKIWPWILATFFLALGFVSPTFGIPQILDFGARASIVPLAIGLALVLGCVREAPLKDSSRDYIYLGTALALYIFLTVNFGGTLEVRSTRLYIELVLPLAFFALPVPPQYNGQKIFWGFVLLFLIPLTSSFHDFIFLERNSSNRAVQIRYLVPVMLPLMAWLAAQSRLTRAEWARAAAILLSPAQILSKTALLPDYLTSEPGARSRFKGLRLVLIGSVHLWILVMFFPDFFRMEARPPTGFLDFLYLGFKGYLRFYFFVYGATCLTRGIFFLSGWSVPPFFNFALLSSSPQDRWRRWDIPVYLTYRLFIFLPVFRSTGSLFLAVFLTFMVVASSYTFQPLFLSLGPGSVASVFAIEKIFVFYALQAVLVYAGIRTERFWPKSDSVYGWWGILITTLLMSVCYGVRHLPLRWVQSIL